MTRLTAAQARRVALAAQGFGAAPATAVTRAQLRRLIQRIQVLQLDSVSVAVRAHYAPVFSRLGPYDRDLLDAVAWQHSARAPRLLVEYWAHEAALMAVEDWPLLRWRMREYTHGRWGVEIVQENPRLADDVIAAVAELGPSTAGQIEAHLQGATRRGKGAWWNRSDTKWVAEALFASGVLTTAHRSGFARHYDLVERVLPADIVARQVDEAEAVRELVLRAAGARLAADLAPVLVVHLRPLALGEALGVLELLFADVHGELLLALAGLQLADGKRVILFPHAENAAELQHRRVHLAALEVEHHVLDLAQLLAFLVHHLAADELARAHLALLL